MRVLLSLLLMACFGSAVAQTWPPMQTESLEGTSVTIPTATKGKKTVIGMAFSQKAQPQFESWLEPIYRQFIDKNGFGAMAYDAHTYMVLMFTGAKGVAVQKAKKQITAATDRDFFPFILLYQGSYKEYRNVLNVDDKDDFHLFVLDENGVIVHHTSGRYTEKKFDVMSEFVEL